MEEKQVVEKKTKEQIENELKAERARKKAAKAARAARRAARRLILKQAGFRANRKMTKDKKTGRSLKGYFVDGSTTVALLPISSS